MAQKKIVVNPDMLKSAVALIFQKKGMSYSDAAIVAEVLVWADLRGHSSHGVARVERYVSFIERGDLDPKAVPVLGLGRAGIFRLDANRCAGPIALKSAIDLAYDRASTHGVAWGVVRDTTHIGAAGFYAVNLASRGMIGIVAAGSGPLMAYHGASVASVSTAPLAIAAPTGDRPPLLLDMASSMAAIGKIRQAKAAGVPIPENWALTKEGLPTTDPGAAAIQLPVGGPKGSGLALMIECLTSLIAGSPILASALAPGAKQRHRQNALVIALDIQAFQKLSEFSREVNSLIDVLKRLPKMSGVDEILMPGERSQRLYDQRVVEGVPISADLWQNIQAL